MLATIEKVDKGYIAQFTRSLDYSIEKVWGVLTENDNLSKWMAHLEIVDLRINGLIKFNFNDGSDQYEEFKITDYENQAILEFQWGQDTVRFEIQSKESNCILILKEYITEITDHTPKDLAGWHMCLTSFQKVLDGEPIEDPTSEEFEGLFEQYKKLITTII